MWEYNHTEELYHHGVKGMKWGVRRTKAQLGHKVSRSLNRTKKKLTDAINAKKAKKAEAKKERKSIKDMTDAELREYSNRMRLERDALDLERQLANLNPKKVSAGEKFVKSVGSTVGPALANVGKQVASDYLNKVMRDALGLTDKKVDPLKELKDSVAELELRSKEKRYKGHLGIT